MNNRLTYDKLLNSQQEVRAHIWTSALRLTYRDRTSYVVSIRLACTMAKLGLI